MDEDIKNKIIEIIQSIRPEIDFPSNQDVTLLGELDSLDIIMLVDELESQLGVTFDADQIIPENFSTFNTLVSIIQTLDNES